MDREAEARTEHSRTSDCQHLSFLGDTRTALQPHCITSHHITIDKHMRTSYLCNSATSIYAAPLPTHTHNPRGVSTYVMLGLCMYSMQYKHPDPLSSVIRPRASSRQPTKQAEHACGGERKSNPRGGEGGKGKRNCGTKETPEQCRHTRPVPMHACALRTKKKDNRWREMGTGKRCTMHTAARSGGPAAAVGGWIRGLSAAPTGVARSAPEAPTGSGPWAGEAGLGFGGRGSGVAGR